MVLIFIIIHLIAHYHRGDDSTPEPSTTVVDGGPAAEVDVGPEAGGFDDDVDVEVVADVCGGG